MKDDKEIISFIKNIPKIKIKCISSDLILVEGDKDKKSELIPNSL